MPSADVVELSLFEEVAEVARGLVDPSLGPLRTRARRYGLKAWFETVECGKEHFEAQVVGAKDVPAASVLAIEVGFHSEHPQAAKNDECLASLLAGEKKWRKALKEAETGEFLGGGRPWRRVSEAWADPDLGDEELAFELGERLAAYVNALEPLRRQRSS